MEKTTLTLLAFAMLAGSALADVYRCNYTARGLIQRITVQAESPAEARRTVQAIIPGAVVTGAHRIGK